MAGKYWNYCNYQKRKYEINIMHPLMGFEMLYFWVRVLNPLSRISDWMLSSARRLPGNWTASVSPAVRAPKTELRWVWPWRNVKSYSRNTTCRHTYSPTHSLAYVGELSPPVLCSRVLVDVDWLVREGFDIRIHHLNIRKCIKISILSYRIRCGIDTLRYIQIVSIFGLKKCIWGE